MNTFKPEISTDRPYIEEDGEDSMLDELRNVRLMRQICSMMGFQLVEVRLHRPFQAHNDWSLSAEEIIYHISFYFKRNASN